MKCFAGGRGRVFSASAANGLQENRVADLFRFLQAGVGVSQAAFAGRNNRQAGPDGCLFCKDLVPEHMERIRRRTDKAHSYISTHF